MKLTGFAHRLDDRSAPGGHRWLFRCPDHKPDDKGWTPINSDRAVIWTVRCETCGVNLSRTL